MSENRKVTKQKQNVKRKGSQIRFPSPTRSRARYSEREVGVAFVCDVLSRTRPCTDVACNNSVIRNGRARGLGVRRKEMYVPSKEDVKMESSWNPSQQIGSEPTIFD